MFRYLILAALCNGAMGATTAAPTTTAAATTAAATTAGATTAGAVAATTPQVVTVAVEMSFTQPLNATAEKAMADKMAADMAATTTGGTGFTAPTECTKGNTNANCAIVTTTTVYKCSTKAALAAKETSADCTKQVYTKTTYAGARRRRLERSLAGETFYGFLVAQTIPKAIVEKNKVAMQALANGSSPAAQAMAAAAVTSAKAGAAAQGATVGSLAPAAKVTSTGGVAVAPPAVGGAFVVSAALVAFAPFLMA